MDDRLIRYREILDCLPQPACLLKDGAPLLQNAASESTFEALLREELPDPPAVITVGEWLYSLRPMDGMILALASRPTPETSAVSFLRAPLSELFASVSSLMPIVEELEDPAASRKGADVNRSLYRLFRSISNLEFSSYTPVQHCTQVDLTAALRALEARIPDPCERGVRVRTELPARPVCVTADPQLLQRALLNLLSNAIRYADAGSTVTVTLAKQPGRALLTVHNKGVPADPDAVFGGSAAAHPHGTAGLGLEIVRTIAAAFGGTLLFRMPEGHTSVTLALPLSSPCSSTLQSSGLAYDYAGGFDHVLLELSDVLPRDAFLPEAID